MAREFQRGGGAAVISRALKGALAILLAAGLLPLIPGTPPVEEAEALAGTTDYAAYFTWENRFGSPTTYPTGGRLRVASTVNTSDFEKLDASAAGGIATAQMSSGVFVSKAKVSLQHNWTLKFTGEIPDTVYPANYNGTNHYLFGGLSSSAPASSLSGVAVGIKKHRNGSGITNTLQGQPIHNSTMNTQPPGYGGTTLTDIPISNPGSNVTVSMSYDSAKDTLTFAAAGKSLIMSNCKKSFGTTAQNSAYLFFGGHIRWNGQTSYVAPGSRNLTLSLTFQSMTLPHFDPIIKDIKVYRASDNSLVKPTDTLAPGTPVRVEAVLQNTNASADGEQFPLHLKLLGASHGKYPTVGVTPTSGSVNTTTGQAVTLVGRTETKVTFNATISQANGAAVTLGLQLVDDSFGGTYENGVTLLAAKPLEAAPDTVDPDNPGADAGHAFHYARFPQPNGNGWNNSPVTVRFYPGDFNQMTLTPSGASAVTLTGTSPDWVQATDTAGTTLSAQAKNTTTGAVSTQKAGSVKIDTTAPRLTYRAVVGELDIDDSAAVSSGVWKLHRTDATGAVTRASSVAQTFPLSAAGDGASTKTVPAPAPGWYVAEDAAGNLSAPLQVSAAEPPAVTRPDPTGPDTPEPAGPPLDPSTPVPDPTTTEGDDGLKHAVINETISEMIDPSAPPFGGALDLATAKKIIAYRYNLASNAPGTGTLTETTELLDGAGNPLSAFDTTAPGTCLIRHVATDAQGNTTTINLTYQLTRDSCPPVRPLQPVDPTDPSGPTQPGEALTPDGPVVTHPDGTQHTEVSCEVTETVVRGTMDAAGAEALLRRHYAVADVDGGDAAITVQSMKNAAGDLLSAIDLSRAADYRITYLVSDAAGNTTAVKLTYHLISSHVPGVVKHPEPGDSADLLPGDDPLHPRPRPLDPVFPPQVAVDGTQHAVVEDVIRVPVQEGVTLSSADARSLMQRRYTFTPEGGGTTTELSLALADGSGAAVPSIDRSHPGAWGIVYKVADASGNTITVRLRYLVVADAPSVTPQPAPDGSGPGGETPGDRDPLPPTQVDVDSDTGLTHAIIEDTVTVPTSDDPMTPAAMGDFLKARYNVKSALPDGKLDRSPARLYRDDDARNALILSLAASQPLGAAEAAIPGEEVDVIDRSAPDDWLAEQVLTDSAGDTTTIRLHYLVRQSTTDVSGGGNGQGGNGQSGGSGNVSVSEAGPLPPSAESGSSRSWSSRIHELPQTGGIFGLCPLHVMFALLMLLASAYGLSRLRQIRAERRWEEDEAAVAC